MDASYSLAELEQRANALYWRSDKSVSRIAHEMDLSKGMLYGLIRPLSSELPCPRCSTSLEHANRTARERGMLSCPDCGFAGEGDEVREQWEEWAAEASEGRGLMVTPRAAAPHPAGGLTTPARHDPVLMGAGLLLVAAGIWLFRELRRR